MRSVFVYRYTGGPGAYKDIEKYRICEPGKIEPYTSGWATVPPYNVEDEDGGPLHRTDGDFDYLAFESRERILPTQVIAKAVNEKVKAIEDSDARKVSRVEKMRVRDECLMDLLPRAFVKATQTMVVIDKTRKLVYIAAGSNGRAVTINALLKVTCRGMNTHQISTAKNATSEKLTHWLRHDGLPEEFVLSDGATLVDVDGGQIALKHEDITSGPICELIDAGRRVTSVKLTHDENMSLLVTQDLQLKQIDFTAFGRETLADMDCQSSADEVTNFMTLWAASLGKACGDLFGHMPWVADGAFNA